MSNRMSNNPPGHTRLPVDWKMNTTPAHAATAAVPTSMPVAVVPVLREVVAAVGERELAVAAAAVLEEGGRMKELATDGKNRPSGCREVV
jgi:hypothetical protein